jgi:hypothetical protein
MTTDAPQLLMTANYLTPMTTSPTNWRPTMADISPPQRIVLEVAA